MATVVELLDELIGMVAADPLLEGRAGPVFDAEDALPAGADFGRFPRAFIFYNGSEALGKMGISTDATKSPSLSSSVAVITHQFVVVLAVQYMYAGQDVPGTEVTPPIASAVAILDSLRRRLHGYRQANYAPWRFVLERPEPMISGDGIVFYTQVWNVNTPMVNAAGTTP